MEEITTETYLPVRLLAAFPVRFGKFVLHGRIARGGMAEVFRATLPGAGGFEKELVVKLIRPELAASEGFSRRFVEEAKTCVKLTHANIVSVFELGVEQGVLYIAMEFIQGATLSELLTEGGKLTPDQGAYVGLEVSRALSHAHRKGVLHRDVTPGNVMIDEDGGVKLLDFGIAAPIDRRSIAHAELGQDVFGTPGHMAPEQLAGERLTPAADLFALGTVLVEAWTGRPPFRRADARASRTALQTEHVHLGSPLTSFQEVVDGCLSRNPAERMQHADMLARALRAELQARNVDIDELVRQLGARAGAARALREGRSSRVTTFHADHTMQPTPFGQRSQTFASRGDTADWSAPNLSSSPPANTRRLEDPTPSDKVDAGTRRMDSDPPEVPSDPIRAGTSVKGRWSAPYKPFGAFLLAVVGLAIFANVRWSQKDVALILAPTTTSSPPPPAHSLPTHSLASVVAPTTLPRSSVGEMLPSATSMPSLVATSKPAAKDEGQVSVFSTPRSSVRMDGRVVGTTPTTFPVIVGVHRIALTPEGLGETFERTVDVSAGSHTDVRGDFNDEPRVTIVRR